LLALTHAGSSRPHATCAIGRPAIAVALPRPGLRCLGSRAQDPSIRRVYRTRRITVEQRPSSPSASRALPCASRQPRLAPCRALKDGASCSCPLSAAPRASLPFTPVSPERAPAAGPRRRVSSNRSPGPTPCEAGWRPNPSRSSIWSPVAGWTPTRLTFASRVSSLTRPFARGKSVVGPPVARWAGSRGISSLVDSARRCKQTSGAGLFAFRVRSFRT